MKQHVTNTIVLTLCIFASSCCCKSTSRYPDYGWANLPVSYDVDPEEATMASLYSSLEGQARKIPGFESFEIQVDISESLLSRHPSEWDGHRGLYDILRSITDTDPNLILLSAPRTPVVCERGHGTRYMPIILCGSIHDRESEQPITNFTVTASIRGDGSLSKVSHVVSPEGKFMAIVDGFETTRFFVCGRQYIYLEAKKEVGWLRQLRIEASGYAGWSTNLFLDCNDSDQSQILNFDVLMSSAP